MRSLIVLSLASILMSGCTDAELEVEQVLEPASIQVSWDDLHELVEAFGYEQGIRQFCEDSTATSQDVFLAELSKLKGFEAEMLERVKIRAGEVQAEFDQADPQEEQEYICTVEMHASSEDRADLAREKWAEIKDLVNE